MDKLKNKVIVNTLKLLNFADFESLTKIQVRKFIPVKMHTIKEVSFWELFCCCGFSKNEECQK